jgi:hypothetical protein
VKQNKLFAILRSKKVTQIFFEKTQIGRKKVSKDRKINPNFNARYK